MRPPKSSGWDDSTTPSKSAASSRSSAAAIRPVPAVHGFTARGGWPSRLRVPVDLGHYALSESQRDQPG